MTGRRYKKHPVPFHKRHEKGLEILTAFMVVVFTLSICAIDSPSPIPLITLVISFAEIMYYTKATGSWF